MKKLILSNFLKSTVILNTVFAGRLSRRNKYFKKYLKINWLSSYLQFFVVYKILIIKIFISRQMVIEFKEMKIVEGL